MTLSTTSNRNDYTGNGVTTVFPYSFSITDAADLVVTQADALGAESTLALTTNYTVSGVGNATGGNVTLLVALTSGYKLTIRRVLALTQPTSIRNQGTFLPEIHEDEFDRQVKLDQQQAETLGRALQLPVTTAPSAGISPVLPAPSANLLLGWDPTAKKLINTQGTAGPTGPAGPPLVASAAARDTLYPAPAADQRVRQKDVGYDMRFDATLGKWVPESKTRAAGPEISMKALGAAGNGVQDDAPFATTAVTGAIALAVAERAAGRDSIIDFDPGVYLFNSSVDFTGCTMRFAPGAIIKRAATVTVTLGRVIAGDYKIIDDSAGGAGQFLLASGASQTDTFNVRWTGTKGDGVTDDTVAFNLAIDLCYGKAGASTRNGLANAKKNRPLFLPAGTYPVTYLDFSGTVGMVMRGAGRLVTTIQVTSSTSVGLLGDMAAYGHWEGFIVSTTAVRNRTHPMVDIDGRAAVGGTYSTGFLFPQQWTFSNVYFNGNDLADVNFAWVRLGGGTAQGDTVVFHNCLCGVSKFAGYMFGSESVTAGNTVDIHFIGGDIQSNRMWGIYSQGGTVHVHGTGMQNQDISGLSGKIPYLTAGNVLQEAPTFATHVGNYPQIDSGGGDFFLHQFSSRGSIRNVRSEGYCLTRGSGIAVVENCETWAGGIPQWAATTSTFVQGQLVCTLVGSVSLDGRAWAMYTATPTPGALATGGTEPTWALARDGFMQEVVSVTSGSAVINCNCPSRCVNKGTLPGIGGNEWGCIVVDPTGANQKFYAKVLAHTQNVSITLDANVPWTGSATIHIGELVTDGAVQWMPYDFVGLEGEFEHIDGGQYEFGQVSMVNVPPQSITCRFSRRDWLYDPWAHVPPFNGSAITPFPAMWAPLIGPGTSHYSWPQTKHSLIDPALLIRTYQLAGARYVLSPLMFPRAFGTVPNGEVGVGAADGAYTLVDTETDKTRNALTVIGGSLAPDPVGFPDSVASPPANTAGKKLNINGGTSTGTAASGAIALRTNPGGGSGSSVNDNRDVFVANPSGVSQSLFGYQKGAVVGNINISAAGNATPNPAGVEVYRYQINGAATINNPINPAEGLALTLEIFNNTAGALTPVFGAAFLGTAPSIGAGKWQTRRFVYDNTLTKWKPTGTWSGDF